MNHMVATVPCRTSGVVRINNRISLEINTMMEWRQMFTQAWQAQANEFVFPHLIKWKEIYSLYEPLLDRINTRVELDDLMKELVSEMACSHIYLDDGDTDVFGRCDEDIVQGFLGVETNDKNEITRILKGDFWSLHTAGPLSIAGMNVQEGDKIVSINHTKVTPGTPLAKLLKGLAGKEIYLGVQDSNFQNGQKPMRKEGISTKPKSHKQQKHGQSGAKGSKAGDKYENKSGKMSKSRGRNERKGKKGMKNKDFNRFNENNGKKNSTKKSQMTNSRKPVQYNAKNPTRILRVRCVDKDLIDYIRYKDDLAKITKRVHNETNNKVGYIHVPSMTTSAYIQWSRAYNFECEHEGLIIDIRGNSGGNISDMLLEKINTKCIGFDIPRYGKPEPFPSHVPCTKNVMVLLCDEQSCSDADCFAQAFKSYNLGVVIGMKTWGGVYGISEETKLVDGTSITHPSSAFYSLNEKWSIENNGVAPDVVVQISPNDFKEGTDPQLDCAIKQAMKNLDEFDSGNHSGYNLHSILSKSGHKL